MPQEYILADFSGGINPSQAADKLKDQEALQAQNCRLDDFGNLASAFGSTIQAKGLVDGASNTNVHTAYIAPLLGVMAAAGQDVFTGVYFGDLPDTLIGQNTAQSKISATTTPQRIFFEVNGTPYVIGGVLTAPVTVDWAPPSAISPTPSGPFLLATAGTSTTGTSNPVWAHSQGLIGTSSGTASCTFTPGASGQSSYVRGNNFAPALGTGSAVQGVQFTAVVDVTSPATIGVVRYEAILEVGGVPVGTPRSVFVNVNAATSTATFGGVADLWGMTAGSLTVAQVNASNFGVRFFCVNGGSKSVNVVCLIRSVQANFYQASGTGITVATGTTGVLIGTYTYGATFVSDQGEESGISAMSNAGTFASQMAALSSIPLGDARTVSRNLYRIGGALNSRYLIGSISDNVTQTYTDNATDVSVLTEGVILPGDVAGTNPSTRFGNQIAKYPCYHLQRLFWAASNNIIWSDVSNNYSYPAVNELPVGSSAPIVGLVSKWNCLIIIKSDSIWILSGTDESNFTLTESESEVGCNQPFTIYPMANGIILSNNAGLWVFNGVTSVKLTPKLDLLLRGQARNNIPAIETVNSAVYGNHCGVATATDYWFSCAAAGSTSNNLLFVISLLNGSIVTRSLDLLSLTTDQSTGYVYGGLANGQIIRMDDFSAITDSQGPFTFTYQTKYTDCNARGSNLAIWGIEVYGNLNGQSLTPTIYYDQGVSSEVLAPITNSSLSRMQRSFEGATSRKAQTVSVRLDGNLTGGPVEISHIKLIYDVREGRSRTGQ